jgi:hypothetical protein
MEIGVILTKKEAEKIRQRLSAISKRTDGDLKVLNLCRMIACDVNRGGRRVSKNNQPKLF